jgi:hypothetical protein
MIPNLQPNTTFAIHLRAASVSGGKDWVGSVTAQGEIHTYWGRIGQIIQHAGKRGDITALKKLILQKLTGKDKYNKVDEYTQQQGWQSQRKQTPVSAQAFQTEQTKPQQPQHAATKPIVDWNHEAPNDSIKWDF